MKHLHGTRTFPPLALVATLATGAGFLLHESSTAGPAQAARDSARDLSRAFRDVARQIGPSVVGVQALHEVVRTRNGDPRRIDPHQGLPEELRRYFGFGSEDDPFRRLTPLPMPLPREGQGTGVIVDEDGIIATNNHVVAGATRVEVKLEDGRKLEAEVIGTDPETDLALLRVEAGDLPAAKLGDSSVLEPGDWVVAVGNPFGLDHTVTVGVVSAIGRSGLGIANPSYEDFIQTDAAINPGNSGGPLVNLDGEVIGINTAIRSSNGGSDGISFAIPSATLKGVLPDLVADGRVSRGWLGVTLQTLTPDLARSFGAKSDGGALISQVLDDTPAKEAGLRPGDIVLSLDGKSLRSDRELSSGIAALDPGTTAHLIVLRDGEKNEIAVELGRRPPQDVLARHSAEGERYEDEQQLSGALGLSLAELPRSLARQQGLDGGVLIREVEPGSPAEEAGLSAGDVILSIGKHQLDSPAEGARLLREAESGVRLLVRTQDGSTRWVFLERRARD